MVLPKILALRGPNIWARFPVLEVWVDLKALEDRSPEAIHQFDEKLIAWLPALVALSDLAGGDLDGLGRSGRGAHLAHVLGHVTLELQRLAGLRVGFVRTRESHEAGVYRVAIAYEEEELARSCLETA